MGFCYQREMPNVEQETVTKKRGERERQTEREDIDLMIQSYCNLLKVAVEAAHSSVWRRGCGEDINHP